MLNISSLHRSNFANAVQISQSTPIPLRSQRAFTIYVLHSFNISFKLRDWSSGQYLFTYYTIYYRNYDICLLQSWQHYIKCVSELSKSLVNKAHLYADTKRNGYYRLVPPLKIVTVYLYSVSYWQNLYKA